MALSLKVPKLEDKPLIVADTRPHKILEFIGTLPLSKANEAATELLEELEILNRQKVSGDTRVKALEAYRPTIINLCDSLSITYTHSTLPLPQSVKDTATLAQSLWLELGYGYKLALLDMQTQLFNLGGSKAMAFTILRAIESAAQLNLTYYQTYFPVPEGVWHDVHQMYYFAVQQSMHELELEAGHRYEKLSSINLAYKEMLLLALADPQHLNPQDMALVADYTARHAKKTQLQGLAIVDNFAGIFLINLNSDNPPIPYLKNINPTNQGSDILLVTVDLARLIHQHIQTLQSKTPFNTQELPDNANTARYIDMLIHLIKYWGAPPKRVFNRSSRINASDIGVGIAAAHYFINDEKLYLQPFSAAKTVQLQTEQPTENTAKSTPDTYESARWQVVNISAGGLALRKLPATQGQIRVGELLSLKNPGDASWSVGVIRWASNGDEHQLDIGTQLISPQAVAGGARVLNQGKFQPALILPAMPALKQDASVIAACGTYSPARILELDENGIVSRIMVTRLIERTSSFERFLFSTL